MGAAGASAAARRRGATKPQGERAGESSRTAYLASTQIEMQRKRELKPRFDVEISARRFLRINPFGEIDANEPVHERRADTSATQRPAWMREVVAIARPAEISEHDLAEPY